MGAEFLAYIFGIILLFVVAKIFIIPLKIVLTLFWSALIGGITLLMINFVGAFVGLYININIVTSLLTGFLGLPGVIAIIVLQYILL